jgi:hypothetical protein
MLSIQQETPPRFRWLKKLEFDGYSESTSILIVQNASYLDTGYYTCYNKDNLNDIYYRQFVYVEGAINNRVLGVSACCFGYNYVQFSQLNRS